MPKRNAQKECREKIPRKNAQGRNRTTDTRIFNPLLYRLSYLGARIRIFKEGYSKIAILQRISSIFLAYFLGGLVVKLSGNV